MLNTHACTSVGIRSKQKHGLGGGRNNVNVDTFLMFAFGISLCGCVSGVSGGGVVGVGCGGRNNVNVDTFLMFAFGIILCGCVSGVSGGGVGGVGWGGA